MEAYKGRITGIVAVALLAGIFGFAVEPSPAEASFVRCRISETVFLPTEAELAAELEGLPPDAAEGTARSGWVTVWAGTDSRCRARLRKGAVFVRETITLSIRLASEPTEAEADAVGMTLFSSGILATWPENEYPNDWSFGYGSGISGSVSDPEWYERYKNWADAGVGYWQQLARTASRPHAPSATSSSGSRETSMEILTMDTRWCCRSVASLRRGRSQVPSCVSMETLSPKRSFQVPTHSTRFSALAYR
jgi:hypothetical protein